MTNSPEVFTATIEPVSKKLTDPPIHHGFHLGTDELVAREMVPTIMVEWSNRVGPIRTVALWRHGRIVDVWLGDCWESDLLARINS